MNLLDELQRRRVFRVLVGYGVVAFGVLQAIEPVMHGLHWPDAVLSYVVVGLAAGFPLAVVLAWAFDVNAGRVERTASAPAGAAPRGVRLALVLTGVGALAASPGLAWYFLLRPGAHGAAKSEGAPRAQDGVQAEADPSAAPSIAVLPFVDMSPGKDQEYFSDGIAEEILNALAQVRGLRVTGRTSSFAFKGKSEDLSDIARKLHVTRVLEGSVRKEGNRVRITAQLINADDGFHLWSQTFDRELTGIFALQDEIARAVTRALEVKLLPGPRTPQAGEQTRDPEAVRLYLLGRQLLSQGTAPASQRSVEALERAVHLDPSFAQAHAWLGYANFVRGVIGTADMSDTNARALALAERAVALAPGLPDGYSVRGSLRSFTTWDWAGAKADYERALELAPGDATAQREYALLLGKLGRVPEALARLRIAAQADPLSPLTLRWLGVFQSASGHPELAEKTFLGGLEVAPENAYLLRELGFVYLLEGKTDRALALFERHPVPWMKYLGLALAQHQQGRDAESRQALAALVAEAGEAASYQIAQVHAVRGERDEAFHWLERGFASNDSGMRFILFDPFLRDLRADPRYASLLRRMNLPVP